MTPRAALPVLASVVLLAGCGGSSSPATTKADDLPAAAASASPGAATPAPGGSAAAGTSGGAPATTTGGSATTTGSSSSTGGSTSGAAIGSQQPAYTSPGTYTYDTSGTVTAGAAPRDASGTATLTVDPPAGGRQHSLLGNDQGRTEQDVVVKSDGAYLAKLVITNPAFDKTFQPATPVLLVPEPASAGRSWSWKATSTDGKTTASVTARVTGRETLTIGGTPTPTTVIESTLTLSGDIDYTAHTQTWYDPAHRLAVKDHTKGEGTFGAVHFTTDVTGVLRSTQPS